MELLVMWFESGLYRTDQNKLLHPSGMPQSAEMFCESRQRHLP
jgi:hypothetical protein